MNRRNMMQCVINPEGQTRGTILILMEASPTISEEIRRCDVENTTLIGYPHRMCWIVCDMTTSGIPASQIYLIAIRDPLMAGIHDWIP